MEVTLKRTLFDLQLWSGKMFVRNIVEKELLQVNTCSSFPNCY